MSRAKCSVVILTICLLIGQWSQPATADAQQGSQTTGTAISGTVIDSDGHPVAGADVSVEGPSKAGTKTAADGSFLVSGLQPGLYNVVVKRASFTTASVSDVAVAVGTNAHLTVTLVPSSFSSLREIGRVSTSTSRVQLNTTGAAITSVSPSTIIDQGQQQVANVLNETPGVIVSLSALNSTYSGGGVALGATTPQLRGALPYETETLIDGHPISVGSSGVFYPNYINPNQLQTVEIVKGPGAMPDEINYAVGGSINYVTLQPTKKNIFAVTFDVDSYGGLTSNYKATGTWGGRLGYAFDYGINGTPGPLNNYRVAGFPTINTFAGSTINGQPICGTASAGGSCLEVGVPPPANLSVVGGTQLPIYACCTDLSSQYLNRTELAKLRYSFSGETSLMVAFLGSQASGWDAQNFTGASCCPQVFTPSLYGSNYSGSVAPGTTIPFAFDTYNPATQTSTESLLESEFRTSVGKDTLLFRYYTGVNEQNVYDFPFGINYTYQAQLWGALPGPNGTTNYYNGQTVTLGNTGTGYYVPSQDRFGGYSGEIDIPAGDNLYSFSVDRTYHSAWNGVFIEGGFEAEPIPPGSSQGFTTYLAKAILSLSSRLNLRLANYLVDYSTHFTPDGGATWDNDHTTVEAPRAALTYQFDPNTIMRVSLGTSIAPPFLGLVTTQSGPPQGNVQGNPAYYVFTANTGNIQPEVGFGYDIGADKRFGTDTLLSTDFYLTTLHGQYLTSTTADGTYTATPPSPNAGITAPLYVIQSQNLGLSRFEGIEMTLAKTPQVGWGYRIQGNLEKAFTYNLPPNIYQTAGSTSANTNLALIPHINYRASGETFNGLSTANIPYSMGYGEINYHWRSGISVLLGATYYGNNNALDEPAFAVVNASLKVPLGMKKQTTLWLTGYNLTGAYNKAFSSIDGGIPVPLVNGQLGTLPGVTIGPAVFHLVVGHQFGG